MKKLIFILSLFLSLNVIGAGSYIFRSSAANSSGYVASSNFPYDTLVTFKYDTCMFNTNFFRVKALDREHHVNVLSDSASVPVCNTVGGVRAVRIDTFSRIVLQKSGYVDTILKIDSTLNAIKSTPNYSITTNDISNWNKKLDSATFFLDKHMQDSVINTKMNTTTYNINKSAQADTNKRNIDSISSIISQLQGKQASGIYLTQSMSKSGNIITWTNSSGLGVAMSIADGDSSSTNELQSLSVTGNRTLSITGGNSVSFPNPDFDSLRNKPTTLAGYGITDAVSNSNTTYVKYSDTTAEHIGIRNDYINRIFAIRSAYADSLKIIRDSINNKQTQINTLQSNFANYLTISTANATYMKFTDSLNLSARINQRLLITDTTNKYLSLASASQQFATKLKTTDTTAMFINYLHSVDTTGKWLSLASFTSAFATLFKHSDTASLNINMRNYIANLLSGYQSTLISGTNIKTVGGVSILGSGNLSVGTVTVDSAGYGITGGNITTAGKHGVDTSVIPSISRLNNSLAGYAPATRQINTTSPLSGGGDLSTNRTLSIADAAADNATKGASTYDSLYFSTTSGLVTLNLKFGSATSNNGSSVTINKPKGRISLTGTGSVLNVLANASLTVTLNNSLIGVNSVVAVNVEGNGSGITAGLNCIVQSQASGTCTIQVLNLSLLNTVNLNGRSISFTVL